MIQINDNTIRLCRQGSCCPVIERKNDGNFTITDDFNGSVQLTEAELDILSEAIDAFKSKKESR